MWRVEIKPMPAAHCTPSTNSRSNNILINHHRSFKKWRFRSPHLHCSHLIAKNSIRIHAKKMSHPPSKRGTATISMVRVKTMIYFKTMTGANMWNSSCPCYSIGDSFLSINDHTHSYPAVNNRPKYPSTSNPMPSRSCSILPREFTLYAPMQC